MPAVRDAQRSSLEPLIRAGIAPGRARGILREFAEHRQDVIAEQLRLGVSAEQAIAAANARMGSELELVENLLRRPELRSWVRRRPSVAFALLPVLAFAAAFCLSTLALVAMLEWRKARGDSLSRASPIVHWISHYAPAYLLWVLPFTAALWLAFFAARRRETSTWPCVGILMTCFVGALTNFSCDFPSMGGAPAMGAGIGISTNSLGPVVMRALSSALLALVVYLSARHGQRREAYFSRPS